jgi:hypothetical protein
LLDLPPIQALKKISQTIDILAKVKAIIVLVTRETMIGFCIVQRLDD